MFACCCGTYGTLMFNQFMLLLWKSTFSSFVIIRYKLYDWLSKEKMRKASIMFLTFVIINIFLYHLKYVLEVNSVVN